MQIIYQSCLRTIYSLLDKDIIMLVFVNLDVNLISCSSLRDSESPVSL